MTRRMLYLAALIVTAMLAISEKAEATFPGKNSEIAYMDFGGTQEDRSVSTR